MTSPSRAVSILLAASAALLTASSLAQAPAPASASGSAPASASAPASDAPPPPLRPRPSSGCAADTDCKGGRVCREGACADPADEEDEEEEPAHAAIGDACKEDADCEAALVCAQAKCAVPHVKPAAPANRAALYYRTGIGVAGDIKNPAPSVVLGLDLALGISPHLRIHVDGAYVHMNGWNGFRFAPLGIGIPFRVFELEEEQLSIEVEPLLSTIDVTGLANDTLHSLALGLSQLVSGNVAWKRLYGTLGLGFEERYWILVGDNIGTHGSTAAGVDFVFRLGVGLTF